MGGGILIFVFLQKYDANGNGELEFEEFIAFLEDLQQRDELVELVGAVAPRQTSLDVNALGLFMREVQKESMTPEQLTAMITTYSDKVLLCFKTPPPILFFRSFIFLKKCVFHCDLETHAERKWRSGPAWLPKIPRLACELGVYARETDGASRHESAPVLLLDLFLPQHLSQWRPVEGHILCRNVSFRSPEGLPLRGVGLLGWAYRANHLSRPHPHLKDLVSRRHFSYQGSLVSPPLTLPLYLSKFFQKSSMLRRTESSCASPFLIVCVAALVFCLERERERIVCMQVPAIAVPGDSIDRDALHHAVSRANGPNMRRHSWESRNAGSSGTRFAPYPRTYTQLWTRP